MLPLSLIWQRVVRPLKLNMARMCVTLQLNMALVFPLRLNMAQMRFLQYGANVAITSVLVGES
jgi:hypothetical protein